ncbi:MAG: hypothetical protein HY342_07345 [Candidatus Lambdaproteobacteria bacterium]|nr:hypothetical protein [Candidatus Lambdaproteobacteria bacterium]
MTHSLQMFMPTARPASQTVSALRPLRRRTARSLGALLPALVLLLALAAPDVQAQSAAPAGESATARKGTVRGRVVSKERSLEGNPVVLMAYALDDKGQPKGGPIGQQAAGPDGSFLFKGVDIKEQTVYQLGTRVDGSLVGSGLFTFPADRDEMNIDLNVPEAGQPATAAPGARPHGMPGGGLGIDQTLLLVEAGVGRVWLTEVLHLDNRGVTTLDYRENPLLLPISADAEEFDIINQGDARGALSREGATLKFFGQLPPGETTFAVRYALPAFWGSTRIERRYAVPVGDIIVLSPPQTLQVSGTGIAPRGSQRIQRTVYDSWGRSDIAENTTISMRVSGAPMSQQALLAPAGGFFVVMAGVVWWFLRKRLRRDPEAKQAGEA